MEFAFKARIFKVGINPCVKVPLKVTSDMVASKGYIRVKGKMLDHSFQQTLVPVRNAGYRLYVNGPMLKGSGAKVGDLVIFTIQQDFSNKNIQVKMPAVFKMKLDEFHLLTVFKKLTPSRQKEILTYLNYLKTEDALMRNIDKVIGQLKKANNP